MAAAAGSRTFSVSEDPEGLGTAEVIALSVIARRIAFWAFLVPKARLRLVRLERFWSPRRQKLLEVFREVFIERDT